MAVIYTIGHSSVSVEEVVNLLKAHEIEIVLDVRSDPHSHYAPQFNSGEIEHQLFFHEIQYIYWGDRLGGKPTSPGFCTMTGVPDYEKMAESRSFRDAIEHLEHLAAVHRVALMCSEADPMQCHRERLIGRVLRERGNEVRHILHDGSIASQPQGTLL